MPKLQRCFSATSKKKKKIENYEIEVVLFWE